MFRVLKYVMIKKILLDRGWFMRKIFFILVVLLSLLGSGLVVDVKAVDYSANVEIIDWEIRDLNGDALSVSNPAIPASSYQLYINWKAVPSAGNVFNEGDTFNISLPVNAVSGEWKAMTTGWTDLNGIADWRINGDTKMIEIVLKAGANGFNSIADAVILTGPSALTNYNPRGLTQTVTIGNISKEIKFNGIVLSNAFRQDRKISVSSSSTPSGLEWLIDVNNIGTVELAESFGGAFNVKNNVYLEDTLEASFSAYNSIYELFVLANLNFPYSLQNTANAALESYPINISTRFTKVSQNPGQSYEDFKNGLAPLQWGVYIDSNTGQNKLVVYFGDIGNNGLKYQEIKPDFAQDAATFGINNNYYLEENRAALENFFTATYGANNIIGGGVARYTVRFRESYPNTVSVPTTKVNTATISYLNNGQATSYSLTGSGIQQPAIGGGTIVLTNAKAEITKINGDTNDPISGAKFKLEIYDTVNGVWKEYTPAGENTTNTEGKILIQNLPQGNMRFVETYHDSIYNPVLSDGYDLVSGKIYSSTFYVQAASNETYNVSVKNYLYKYTVTYKPGTHGDFADNVHSGLLHGTNTPGYSGAVDLNGNPLGKAGYVFDGWDLVVSPTVTSDATYIAKWRSIPIVTPVSSPTSTTSSTVTVNPSVVNKPVVYSVPDTSSTLSIYGYMLTILGSFYIIKKIRKI